MNKITNLGNCNRFALASAVFRVYICFHLLKDIYFQWDFIPLLYGNKSFHENGPTVIHEVFGINSFWLREHINLVIGFYILAILLFLFGIGRYITSIVLLFALETMQRLNPVILNGGDNLLKFCALYMCFIDSYRYFSVHAGNRKPGSTAGGFSYANFCSNLGGMSICVHLCLIYFFSAIHKIHSDVWFNGVATYYTLQIERFQGTPFNETLAKNGIFVTVSTYFTWLVEMAYPMLIWFRQTRYVMIVCAVLIHVGIYVFMMIYDFQVVFIMVQLFFIPQKALEGVYAKAVIKWKHGSEKIKRRFGKVAQAG